MSIISDVIDSIKQFISDEKRDAEIRLIRDKYEAIYYLMDDCSFDEYLFLRRKEYAEIQNVRLKYQNRK